MEQGGADVPQQNKGREGARRSSRSHARADANRAEAAATKRQVERTRKRTRAQVGEDRVAQRAARRVGERAEAARRIAALARAGGWELEGELREVGGVGRIKEKWRWSFTPAGGKEQLVLFDHGEYGVRADQEVRAAILESEYGRGLYYASEASRGREIGYYDGVEVSEREYGELDEYTGLRHTLEVGSRINSKMINGIHGVTGMQYANTSRGGVEDNNASFSGGTAVLRVSVAGGVVRGQPVLLPYKWTAATWEEIDSKVVGVCAYEERGQDQGLGEDGGTYVVELVSALRKGGLATEMIRKAHEGWVEGQGRMELQVHLGNRRALEYYGRLGMSRCKWWEKEEGRGGQRLREGRGGSLYTPKHNCQMMQVEARELNEELRRRRATRHPVTGIEYVRVKGVQGLREAGVLAGVRAMVARVYGSEAWYVEEEGYAERVACLYEGSSRGKHTVTFIVARMTGEDRWARRRAERNETDEGGQDEAGSVQADGQAEGQTDSQATGEEGEQTNSQAREQAGREEGDADQQTGGVNQRTRGVNQRTGGVNQRKGGVNQRTGGVNQRTGGVNQRTGGVNQRTGDQEGGRAGESRGASTAVLDGAAEEGRSGQEGKDVCYRGRLGSAYQADICSEAEAGGETEDRSTRVAVADLWKETRLGEPGGEAWEAGIGRTRRRRNRGNAGDTEGEGRAGAVGKRGRQGEEGSEEEGGGKRQDRKMERQWRKRNRGDG
jgi:hypothetical protein